MSPSIIHNMYSISYFNGRKFLYTGDRQFTTAVGAASRALAHMDAQARREMPAEEVPNGAAIIYNSKRGQTRVSSLLYKLHSPNFK